MNPFVGLRPFDAGEALLFFGRNEQTLELLERLSRHRFLAVVGSSGSGKSSLVRAGLLSQLKAGFLVARRDRWRTAVMKPGARPFSHLAEVVGDGSEALAHDLRERGLTALLEVLAPLFASGDTSLLLLVDQFEELFRVGGDDAYREEAAAFVSLLLAASEAPELPVYVVLTLRSDFLGDCDRFRGLPEKLNQCQYLVPRLARQKRREAIEGPVRLFGKQMAPRLVDRLLNDVGEEADQLPLLQHTLMRLWETGAADPVLDLAHYEAVGTLREALSRHADEAMEGLDSGLVEKVFRALTATDPGRRRIRRPLPLDRLVAETGASREEVEAVIEAFRAEERSFLMPARPAPLTGSSLIDLSHESLIRQWPRLQRWVDAEAEAGSNYQRLTDRTRRYAEETGSLLSERDLAAALRWQQAVQPTAAWAERYGGEFAEAQAFLAASQQQEREREEREKRRRRELAAARVREKYSLRLLLAVLLVFTGYATWKQHQAQKRILVANYNLAQAYEQKAGAALTRARNVGGTSRDYQEAWLYSLAALGPDIGDRRLPVSTGRLLSPDLRYGAFRELWHSPRSAGAIGAVAFSPDGKYLAAGFKTGLVRLWNLASGTNTATLPGSDEIWSLAFSPDSGSLAAGAVDGTIRVFEVAGGKQTGLLQGHTAKVWSLAFSPDGKHLASGAQNGTIRIWNPVNGHQLAVLAGHEREVCSVAFSPDGRTLASGGRDRKVRLWDVAERRQRAVLSGHLGTIWSVAYSRDGRLASGSDGMVRIWKGTASRSVVSLAGDDPQVWTLAFQPDGSLVAAGTTGRQLQVWNGDRGTHLGALAFDFAFEGTSIEGVAFSPDYRLLVSGAGTGQLVVWDLARGRGRAGLASHNKPIQNLAFLQGGRQLVSQSVNGVFRIWDLANGGAPSTPTAASPLGARLPALLPAPEKLGLVQELKAPLRREVTDAPIGNPRRLSPDHRQMAVGYADGSLSLWAFEPGSGPSPAPADDAASRQALSRITLPQSGRGSQDPVTRAQLSPDARRLAVGFESGIIRTWDMASRQETAPLQGHTDKVLSLAFSPDGKLLASGSTDRTIRIWELASGKGRLPLRGHTDGVSVVSFDPEGRRLASQASHDSRLRVWEVASGKSLAVLESLFPLDAALVWKTPYLDDILDRTPTFHKLSDRCFLWLQRRLQGLDLQAVPERIDLSPVDGYHFPRPRTIPRLEQPRDPGTEPLGWLLQDG